MPVALRRLVESSSLGLRLVNPGDDDARVEWAHVSELTEVARWLSGGELLLTTGMQLRDDPESCLAYCRQLRAAGVVAVGLSVGPGLTWQRMPESLVAAAHETGMPLVEVPFATPLEAIVREVARILELESTERLRWALRAQQSLTASAIRPGGVEGIVRALVAAASGWAVVCDRWLHVLSSTVDDPRERLEALGLEPGQVMPTGVDAAAYTEGDERTLVLPIGVDRMTRGVLVVGRSSGVDFFDRVLFSSAVSLLTLELEHRHQAEQAVWRQGRQLLDWLETGTARPEEVQVRLLRHGVQATSATGFVVDPGEQDISHVRELLQDLVPHLRSLLLAERAGTVHGLLMDAPDDLATRLERIAPGIRVGIGRPVAVHAAGVSLRQAGHALDAARSSGRAVVRLEDLRGFRAVRDLADESVLRALADAVLGPLDEYDRRLGEPVLVPTVREFLKGPGTIEASAAALGVHRHTVRQRLERVRELSGLDLRDGEDRFELLLATRVRDLLGD